MNIVEGIKTLFGKKKPAIAPLPEPSPYYFQRLQFFAANPIPAGAAVMVGDSITEGAANHPSLFPGIFNRGISGDTTIGVVHRLPQLLSEKPGHVILLIGTNNLGWGTKQAISRIVPDLVGIVNAVKASGASVTLQTILPVNRAFPLAAHRDPAHIIAQNIAIMNIGKVLGCRVVDLFSSFVDNQGALKPALTFDGLHINDDGYRLWSRLIS